MTYSIVARCARTGRLGIGTSTFSLACGSRSESVRPNVGICKSQAFYKRPVDPLALNLLAQGLTPGRVMGMLEANDPDFEYRQIGMIDRDGQAVAHTGPKTRPWSGHRCGPNHAAFGNVLAGPQVVDGIVAGFHAEPDADLEFRLLRALEGGHDAGGQLGPDGPVTERSAWLRVVDRHDYPIFDLRVDRHPTAIAELRRVFEEYKRYEAYYWDRSRNPRTAMPQEAFVATLAKSA